MGIFAIPLCIIAFAFLVNGFPDINIGNKITNKYYNKEEIDEDED